MQWVVEGLGGADAMGCGGMGLVLVANCASVLASNDFNWRSLGCRG